MMMQKKHEMTVKLLQKVENILIEFLCEIWDIAKKQGKTKIGNHFCKNPHLIIHKTTLKK